MRYLLRRLARLLPWLLVGLLACLITLAAMLPAAWIVPRFADASQGHVNLIEPVGSLWHGSATLMLAAGGDDAGGATLLPGRIEWTTAFWPLFTGHIRMRMWHTEAMSQPVTVEASPRGATLAAGSLRVPASLLAGLGAPFNTLDLQGNMSIQWTDWRRLGGDAFGHMTVSVDDAASRVSLVRPLGSYRVLIVAGGSGGTLTLTSVNGPLLLDGNGRFDAGHFNFLGTARAAPGMHERLLGLLNILGRQMADDTYQLAFDR